MKRIASLLIAAILGGAIFGAATSYLGCFIEHSVSAGKDAINNPFIQVLALPSVPGAIFTQARSGYDWRWDEAWSFRHQIAFSNTLIWATVALCIGSMSSIFRASLSRRET